MRGRLAAAAATLAAATACGAAGGPAAAVVGGEVIAMDDVAAALERFVAAEGFDRLAAQGDPGEIKRQFEQRYLGDLIRRAVQAPAARALGITVTEAEVEARLERLRSEFGTEEAFDQALAQQAMTLELLRELLRDQIREDELRAAVTAEVAPTDDAVRAYYDDNAADYTETRASHILVRDRGRADEIAGRLRAADDVERLFGRLAREHSEDPGSASAGGDLGYFRPGQFVEPFEEAVAGLEVGEVSGVVTTEFGFHVILVTDRRRKTFADVGQEIERQLAAEAAEREWERWKRAAYARADVDVNPRFGEFDVVSQQVVDAPADAVPGVVEATTPPPEQGTRE